MKASAFTPAARLRKRKTLQKRAAFLVQTLEQEKMREIAASSPVTPFRPGDVIRVKVAVLENRGRANAFTGICIARRNRGDAASFTCGGGGEERPGGRAFPSSRPVVVRVRQLGAEVAAGSTLLPDNATAAEANVVVDRVSCGARERASYVSCDGHHEAKTVYS